MYIETFVKSVLYFLLTIWNINYPRLRDLNFE